MFLFITSLRDTSRKGSQVYTFLVTSFFHSFIPYRVWSKSTGAASFSFVYGARSWLVTFDLLVAAGVKCRVCCRTFRRTFTYAKNGNCRTANAPARKICATRWKRGDREYADPPRILCLPSRSVTFVRMRKLANEKLR